jgi:hypothetical protein
MDTALAAGQPPDDVFQVRGAAAKDGILRPARREVFPALRIQVVLQELDV